MDTTISCPNCSTEIELTETLAQPIIEAERGRLQDEARKRAESPDGKNAAKAKQVVTVRHGAGRGHKDGK